MEITKQSVERSGNLNPMWGKRQSLETKKKISDSQKNATKPFERQLGSMIYYNLLTRMTKQEMSLYINF